MSDSLDSLSLPEVMSLTPRERDLVRGLLAGLSESAAMRAAGFAESTIRAGTGRVCHRDRIQQGVQAAMTAAGITPELLAERLRDGLDAVTEKGFPDFNTRHKYLDTCLRIGGYESSEQLEERESYEDEIVRLRSISEQ